MSDEVDKLISEGDLNTFIHQTASAFGWEAYHQIDTGRCPDCGRKTFSKRIGPGFPDWVIVHPNGRLIFAEAKSQKGTLRPGQPEWLVLLNRTRGNEVYLWRPSDMTGIAQILEPAHDASPGTTLVLPGFDLYQPTWPGKQTP